MYQISTDPLLHTTTVSKTDGDTIIYFSEGSPFWEEYLAWVAEGNTAEEWNPQG